MIDPAKPKYAPGEHVSLLFRNTGEGEFGLNACYGRLQKRHPLGWGTIYLEGANCPDNEFLLPLGGARLLIAGNAPLPETLEAGTYRYFDLGVRDDDGDLPRSQRVSSTFEVGSS